MEKNITITDVVDLIIEKKIKEVKEQISLKEKEIDDYFEKHREGVKQKAKNLKAFLEKHFEPEGLKHFARVSGFMGFGPFGIIRGLAKEERKYTEFEIARSTFLIGKPFVVQDLFEHLSKKFKAATTEEEKNLVHYDLHKSFRQADPLDNGHADSVMWNLLQISEEPINLIERVLLAAETKYDLTSADIIESFKKVEAANYIISVKTAEPNEKLVTLCRVKLKSSKKN